VIKVHYAVYFLYIFVTALLDKVCWFQTPGNYPAENIDKVSVLGTSFPRVYNKMFKQINPGVMDFHYMQGHVTEIKTGSWNVLDWVIPLLFQAVPIKEGNVWLVGTDMALLSSTQDWMCALTRWCYSSVPKVNAGIVIPIRSRHRPHSSPSYQAAQFETSLKKVLNLKWATATSIDPYFSADRSSALLLCLYTSHFSHLVMAFFIKWCYLIFVHYSFLPFNQDWQYNKERPKVVKRLKKWPINFEVNLLVTEFMKLFEVRNGVTELETTRASYSTPLLTVVNE
jgi:hypothetical protein